MRLTIVMYHYVRPIAGSAYPGIKGLELAGFHRQLDYLQQHYTVVTAEAVLAHLHGEATLPENACWLTFDDGYRDHLQHALPALLERGLQGSFFPPARPILEGKMLDVNAIQFILASGEQIAALLGDLRDYCLASGLPSSHWQRIYQQQASASRYDPAPVVAFKRLLQRALPAGLRQQAINTLFAKYVAIDEATFCRELYLCTDELRLLLANGMFVGSHGYDHNWLNTLSSQQQANDINRSLGFLDDLGVALDSWIMCYPYGAYNDDTLDVLRQHHCAAGLTTQVAVADLAEHSPLELPRLNTNDFPQ